MDYIKIIAIVGYEHCPDDLVRFYNFEKICSKKNVETKSTKQA